MQLDIANLLFWELWECLTIPSKSQYQFVGSFHSYLHAKINFITHFFLKILQRNRKLVILGNLDMPGHTHLNDSINLKKPLIFICWVKINFILYIFLEILQRHCKLVLDTLGMPGYADPKWYYQLVQNFSVDLQAKKQLYSPSFSGDTAKICKLLILGTLRMSAYINPKW